MILTPTPTFISVPISPSAAIVFLNVSCANILNAQLLNLDLAGKTGTTNDNTDAWFVGYTSNLVIGVYVGHDEPRSLGRYETGSKTAMPIFKEFVQNAISNYEARPFKVAKNIKMMVIDVKTGKKADFGSKETIIESFKKEKIENQLNLGIDDLNYKISKNNILKFY